MLDGEILKVDAHTQTNTHFVKVTTYEAGGNKTFNDSVARQTWQKNRATISAGSGSLAYAGAKRMPNVLVDTITAGTSIIAQANLPNATTTQKGIQENATSTEAKALIATDKTITPSTLSDVNGGLLTKIIEIGDWDMDTTQSIVVNHSIADFKKIRCINVIIRNDTDTSMHDLIRSDTSGVLAGSVTFISSTQITLFRVTSGFFDSSTFDSTSFNRGWIAIMYSI
ncbi:MAG: hypothetical protein OEV44_00295 [Spirochaetota bacterium]|nr:hypothetical protein [Spirochaetota bacterium]